MWMNIPYYPPAAPILASVRGVLPKLDADTSSSSIAVDPENGVFVLTF
jgi:hypothetical protein